MNEAKSKRFLPLLQTASALQIPASGFHPPDPAAKVSANQNLGEGTAMCDETTVRDNEQAGLSRRDFAVSGAALAMLLPSPANAVTVTESDVNVKTPDGVADCYFVHPSSGSAPAVLIWPDILGLRPAFRAMGKRLAESGYAVLVVNPFYRNAKAPILKEGESFSDPAVRAKLTPMARVFTADTQTRDANAFVSWLDGQKAVNTRRKMATTGYCMGGPFVMRTAAAFPNRVGAACTFHGGGLATDKPDSPHLLIPKMKASFLIAIAENDDKNDPKAKDTLRASFAAAKLPAEIEVYGANHGWCPPDMEAYNKEPAEKAWSRQLALFAKALA
jgi:carboxymethylenebutenolidase